MIIKVTDYNIQSTGNDGGHRYLKTSLDVDGKVRDVYVFFEDKLDEQKLKENCNFEIEGRFQDNSDPLVFINAKILKHSNATNNL